MMYSVPSSPCFLAGPIGLVTFLVAKVMGAAQVVISGKTELQLVSPLTHSGWGGIKYLAYQGQEKQQPVLHNPGSFFVPPRGTL